MDRRSDKVMQLKLTCDRRDTGGHRPLGPSCIIVMMVDSGLWGRLSVHESHLTSDLFY